MSVGQYDVKIDGHNGKYVKKSIILLRHILEVLTHFHNNYGKKFNIGKFAEYMHINPILMNQLIALIIDYQNMFQITFKDYKLVRKENYLVVESIRKTPIIIVLTPSQVAMLNDLYYRFKVVQKGKGFDISHPTPLTQKLNILIKSHPCLFSIENNPMIYISEIGQKIGNILISYNKSGKHFSECIIDNYIIKVDKDGGT